MLDWATWLVLAAIAYIPSFLTQPGKIAADTKQYLYLDPGRVISSAIAMWNPDIGAGGVTHENIGYLFPMGPYYWVVQQLGIPMWVGQRFWMGSLFFAAGTGAWKLCRLLGVSRAGQAAAALAYMLTPFVIDDIARQSAVVMPWAALGWFMSLTVLAVRKGGWRYPALFAIVVALVGGVNATSILLVGLAPLLWLFYAAFVTKEAPGPAVLKAALRIGVLSLGTSLWWIAGLWAEGAYGINILKYTETLPTVTVTSLASEAIRGLGYWYFYGQDKLQPWTSASLGYTQWPWLIAVSFAVPTICFLFGMLARWRYRAFAVGLVLLGVVFAVGAYPYTNPTPLGNLIKTAGSDSTVGLAMRSSNRIVPLVILGLALLLGAGISAVHRSVRWAGLVVLVLSAALLAANLPPLWDGTLVASNLDRPSALPGYITEAAHYLNAQNHDTRVLEIPGEDFAYYTWGVAADPVWPGLMTRPYLIRGVQPIGEPGTVNLLEALDESIQDGVFVPSTLAPIARLFSAGDILFESDVQYERFDDARPQPLWLQLVATPGLAAPTTFGTPTLYKPIEYPLTDETQLAIPTGAAIPPPVAVFAVPGARTIVRTETPQAPLVVDGDGVGLVNAAAAGLLADNPTIFYSASAAKTADSPSSLKSQLARGAILVLTDSNDKQLPTWGTLNDNYGYVESAGEKPLAIDPSEVAMPVFPAAGSDTQTVAEISQVASVRATSYGNPIANTPENRPFQAIDGNRDTAWTEGAFSPGTGQSLQIALTHPVTADHITLLQPQTGKPNRHVTRVTLTFNGNGNGNGHGHGNGDGHRHETVELTHASRVGRGQVVTFPRTTFRTLTVTVDATSAGTLKTYESQSAVGFAEVDIPGVPPATETLRLPTDLLGAVGTASASHQLDIVLNRERADAATPPRTDPELTLDRQFTLPTARDFSIGGLARISTLTADPVINSIVGRTSATTASSARGAPTVVFANSSGRLPGDLNADASAAVDGNPGTSWMPGLGPQDGGWVDFQISKPITFDHLNLQLVADGRHSIPTVITVTTASGSRRVVLPHIGTGVGRPQGSVTPVLAQFPALTGANIKITIDATEPVHFLDYVSGDQNTEPVGLAEAGIPGVAALSTPAQIPTRCWSNLLQVDGKPIDIAISGTSSTALSNGGLSITGCGNSADGIRLSAGTHILTTSSYTTAGLNVDSLTLASAAGGAPLPLTSTGLIPVTPPPAAHSPSVKVLSQNRTGMKVSVTGDGTPFWLVLGESQSRGWVATTRSGVDLGSSTLIDGYANGWYVPASAATGKVVVSIEWQPQRVVNAAIVASSAALAASLGLVLLPPGIVAERLSRRRRSSRKRKRRGAGRGASRGTSAAAQAGAASEAGVLTDAEAPQANTAVSTEGLEPRLANPLRSGGRRPTWYWAVGIAVLCGLVAAVAVAPLAGLAVGAVLLLGLLVDRSRVLLVLGALGFISLTGVVMARGQFIHRFVPDINWPAHFPVANSFTWLAICLLAADAIVVAVRLRPSASATRSVVDDGPTGPEVAEGAAAEGAAAEDGGGEGTEESARGAVEESVDESAGVVTGGADAEAADEGSGAEEHADEGSVGDGAAEAEEHAEEQGGAGGAGEENGGSAEHGDGGVL